MGALGCGGGVPLLHPAHVLHPGDVSMGAGMSAQIGVQTKATIDDAGGLNQFAVDQRAVSIELLTSSTSLAPWVGARIGIAGDNEAGLTYTGRSIRIDGRHAWTLKPPSVTLSLGVGASAIMPKSPDAADADSAFGGGVDVPLLIGWKSTNDLYSVWFGPRGGFETIRGELYAQNEPGGQPVLEEAKAQHYHVGFVAGLRAGFRHVHVAIELDGAFHYVTGSLGPADVSLNEFTLTPGGALILSF